MKLGLLEILGLTFIILKLTHVIDWDWWLVLIPLYLTIALYLLAIFLIAVALVCAGRKL
jgi:hypothetical protein